MIKRIKTRHFFIVLGIAALLSFQNCSSPTADEGSENSVMDFQSSLPFAYSSKLDTISHMSCSRIDQAEPRAYYSFKAAAMTANAGLGLTNEYLLATGAYSPQERGRALAVSKLSSNTLMQLSIRNSQDYQSIWQSTTLGVGQELDAFLPALDTDAVSGHLANMAGDQVRNYFPGSGDKRLMEANLRFLASETSLVNTRTNLANRTSMLVMGFTDSTDVLETKLRGPTGVTKQNIFGTGYYLDFRVPAGFTTGERRSLNSISEKNLLTGATIPSSWNCSSSFQFMVIRPEDIAAGRVACYTGADRHNAADPAQLSRLYAIRRVLRAEDWYVDVANRCVVPKLPVDSCYGDRTGRPAVNYSSTTCTGDSCPHYVTVCLRN